LTPAPFLEKISAHVRSDALLSKELQPHFQHGVFSKKKNSDNSHALMLPVMFTQMHNKTVFVTNAPFI